MVETYGKKGDRSLLPLCETRWNSMQGCFASLLRVQTALRQFMADNWDDDEFPDALVVLDDPEFWSCLEESEQLVRPLCLASFMLQHDNNTLSDVTFCFQQLFDTFSTSSYSETLTGLLEKRWADCEQPLFMLDFALDVKRLEVLNQLPARVVDELANFALLYYRKLFDKDAPSIKGEMSEWINGKYISSGKCIKDFEGLETPPLAAFWQDAKGTKMRHGRNIALCELALSIFAMGVNTATCERYFSELALIHTARRNRLAAEKARKLLLFDDKYGNASFGEESRWSRKSGS
ncbi:hypothetical protein L915_12375 [Phytophthora nicotianae]|uniref:HAT C-terminal dimerisation domain-containing protein n=1 Tax=Phytophthora nicotianae TaxID=4792 RepID=W2GGR4_PHYNI|nr:hypothetical protein L915_12375 [Phytophthora nicotianae]